MTGREKVIKDLEEVRRFIECENLPAHTLKAKLVIDDAIALLKAQEPVKPMLARGWYWCGGVGCRYSLTSAHDDDSPARKPNYCEKCGREVKWDA